MDEEDEAVAHDVARCLSASHQLPALTLVICEWFLLTHSIRKQTLQCQFPLVLAKALSILVMQLGNAHWRCCRQQMAANKAIG